MHLKINKIGNQLVLPLPEKAVKALELVEGSEVVVAIEEDNKWMLITTEAESVDLDEIDADYAKMLIEFIEENRESIWFASCHRQRVRTVPNGWYGIQSPGRHSDRKE